MLSTTCVQPSTVFPRPSTICGPWHTLQIRRKVSFPCPSGNDCCCWAGKTSVLTRANTAAHLPIDPRTRNTGLRSAPHIIGISRWMLMIFRPHFIVASARLALAMLESSGNSAVIYKYRLKRYKISPAGQHSAISGVLDLAGMASKFCVFALFLACVAQAAEWPTDGGNPKRNGWQKDEKILTPANVKDLKLIWKIKLDNAPREMHSLFPPLIVEGIATANGTKQIAIAAGSSDNIY